MNNLNGRVKKLESLIGTPPPAPLRPAEILQKIGAVLVRVFKDMPERLKIHAERVFRLDETKTDEEAKGVLNAITLARKLKGGKA